MAGGRCESQPVVFAQNKLPQWSPGLMAGGRQVMRQRGLTEEWPQWSPGLMAGGRRDAREPGIPTRLAAMEPRPDGRGKVDALVGMVRGQVSRNGAPA